MLLVPATALAQTTTQAIEYDTTDALGSVRAVKKQVNGQWQVVARHDFMAASARQPWTASYGEPRRSAGHFARREGGPFGEEVAPPSPPQDKRLFTGKERDSETGQDYFGARYYRADIGRFTTVYPLTASARTPDPQTFNRYAYALNNPLRFVDPDGLQASKACAENPNCTIDVRVRVLWDSGAGHETGVTKEQKRAFEQYLLSKARKDFGTANVALSVTYDIGVLHRGTATPGLDHNFPFVENTKGDSLNVLVSQVGVRKGIAGLDYKATGTIVIGLVDAIPTLDGWTDRFPFYSTPTLTHEMIHDITGTHWAIPALYDSADGPATLLGLGIGGAGAVRSGLTNKPYAVDANPKAKKPQKK